MKQIKQKLVYIEWLDSYGCSSEWCETTDTQPVAHHCHSVGWIVGESEAALTIVPHLAPKNREAHSEEQGCGDMTIPKVCIIRKAELRKAELSVSE